MIRCSQITVVFLANSFNLPIFQQVWLLNNDIVTQDEFDSGTNFFTPAAVSVQTSEFELLITQDRVQLVINSNFDNSSALIFRVMGGIVKKLPHTPYKAVGLNYNYIIEPSTPDGFVAKCKSIFVCSDNPLAECFASDDSRFGIYLSTDMFDARLRLDLKPINLNHNNNDALRLSFNANSNASDIESINNLLDRNEEIKMHTQDIAEKLHEKLES
jgi:hypothetical protein